MQQSLHCIVGTLQHMSPTCDALLLQGLPWLPVHWLLLLPAETERATPAAAAAPCAAKLPAVPVAAAAATVLPAPAPLYCPKMSVTCSRANSTQRFASCGAE